MIDCNEWRTERRHECANMGKVKRLELWWELYRTSLPVWDLENFRPMDFCWHEYTSTSMCSHASIKPATLIPSPFIRFVFPALNTSDVPQRFVASGRRRFQVFVIQNPMVQYQDQSPPPIPVPEKKQIQSTQLLLLFFFYTIRFYIILPSKHRSSVWLHSFSFSVQGFLWLNKETKLRIHNITAKAALKFGSEAWVLKKRDEQRLEV